MASLWKDSRTPNYVACFTAVTGQRLVQWKRSTHTGERKLARKIADEMEEAAQGRRDADAAKSFLAGINDLRARRALTRVFDEILNKTTGRGLGGKSVKVFIENWLATTKPEVAIATWVKYENTVKHFLASLKGAAEQDMSSIRREDIARFRDEQGQRVAASTANVMLKIVRIIFAAAEADGVIVKNEARNVKTLKVDENATGKRRAFTLPELRKLLAICDDEWRSLILFGFYSGARLGDLALLTWQNIDLQKGELHYTSKKTRRTVIVPLASALQTHLLALAAGDDPRQPIHLRAYETVMREGRTGSLSRQFGELLAEAKLRVPRTHEAKERGEGRSGRRKVSEISFHALRHTSISLLKSAGVSDAVAQDLAGHESVEMSRIYTHIEESAKREAINRLPEIY